MIDQTSAQDDYLPWNDPEFIENPFPWFDRLRKEHPIYQTNDGTYVLTRYEDITKFCRLPVMRISNPEDTSFGDGFIHTVLGKEPPEHTNLRGLTNKWFTPELCRNWAEAGVEVINRVLDEYQEGEIIDAHHDLGMIPAHAAICKAMQLPADEPEPAIAAMLDVMRAIRAAPSQEEEELSLRAFEYMGSRIREMIKIKQEHPGDGMSDMFLEILSKGEMNEEEVVQNISLFWASGAHNPSYMIASGLEFFANHPEVYEMYREQPGKRNGIRNEILRLFPAELSFIRYPAEDIEILGTLVPKNSKVRFMTNSANRDPEVFPDPHEFNPDRPPNQRHVTFGIGIHGCAGQMISRAEEEHFFDTIAARVSRMEMAGESTFDATDRSRAYITQSMRLYF